MKKILIFHHYNTCVGAGLCLFQIALSLKNKYDVVVCLPNVIGDLNDKLLANGIRTIQLDNIPRSYSHYNGSCKPFVSRLHLKDIFMITKSKKIIKEIIKQEKPDIALVNSMTLFWLGKILKDMKIKSYCYIRETYCNTYLNIRTNYIKKSLNKYFDKLIFISKFDMMETGNFFKKYELVTDKVDFSLYDKLNVKDTRKELSLPQNKKIILYVGGDNIIKGPMVIIKAIKYIKSDVKLVYLQHTKTSNKNLITIVRRILSKDISFKVEKYITKHNLTERVILRGATDEVEKYFTACDIVVFPSIVAHQARPIYEAGYAKKTIIATDFKNTSEFLNEKTGFVFKKNDYRQLAKIIDEILNKRIDIQDKIINNYNQTLNHHNYNSLSSEIIQIFEKE